MTIGRWGSKERGSSNYANSVIALDPNANTLSCPKISNWKVVPTLTGGYQTVAMPENEKDPTLLDRHSYACEAFLPEQNATYLASGANQTGPGGHPDDTWKFDLKTNPLSLVMQTTPAKELLTDAMNYDSANRLIVRSCFGRVRWFLDPRTTEKKTRDSRPSRLAAPAQTLPYDEAHDVFVRMDTNLTTRELEWWVFRLDLKRLPPAVPAGANTAKTIKGTKIGGNALS